MTVKSKGAPGWVLVLAILLGVLVPIGQFGNLRAILAHEEALKTLYGNNWEVYQTLAIAVLGVRAAIGIWVAHRLVYRIKSSTPKLAIYGIWIAFVGLGIASLTLVFLLSSAPFFYDRALMNMLALILICVVATFYLIKSRKVKDIYQN